MKISIDSIMKKIRKGIDSSSHVVLLMPAVILAAAVIFILSKDNVVSQYQEQNGGLDREHLVMQTMNQEETDSNIVKGKYQLEDGLYQGTGKGYGGEITVAVQIEQKSIANIWILSAPGEDNAFLNRAEGILETIISEQSTDVDVMSGATYSSKGILDAVRQALSGENKAGDEELTNAVQELADANFGELKDGIYFGESDGFGGKIQVQVRISEGKILDIQIVKADGEGAAYLKKASSLTDKMLQAQSTNVDAVSGATFTSNGIIKAVRNALEKAAGKETGDENVSNSGKAGAFPYKDGVYFGHGTGFAGEITVAIIIEDKTLKAAIVTEASDDSAFLTKAKKILEEMVARQSVEVDAVTGATYSSNGIIDAVKEAVKAAKNAGKPSVNAPLSSQKPSTDSQNVSGSKPGSEGTSGIYKDGTYIIQTTCSPNAMKAFKAYTLSMTVTIKNDWITAIKNVKGVGTSYEKVNDSFINRAVNGTASAEGIVSQITSKGTLEGVDVVSGATCTSNALLEGAKSALNNAKKTPGGTQKPSTPVTKPSPSVPVILPEVSTPSVYYKDGIYSGTALCSPDYADEFYAYNLSLKVTVSGNRITAITDLEGSGNRYDSSNSFYFNYAADGSGSGDGVVPQIILKQDTAKIDAVSGATCSSKAIISAVEQAISEAK